MAMTGTPKPKSLLVGYSLFLTDGFSRSLASLAIRRYLANSFAFPKGKGPLSLPSLG